MPKVKLFANFREVAKVREVEVDAKDVQELLKKIVEKIPELKELIFDGEKVRSYVNVMVNGEIVKGNRELKKDDIVAIFPPLSGG
ncbi:MAG: MoaD/ThiS family protein [Archaeoglobaceae archaeon]|nr:MoaD/ThiS family protein [Archaeoglobaceae archaeon]MCX8152436.1 MoaD/ThiS family protein [Archaeoglobaceae archaeon]MDW8013776.1 ubiquitin-like small modifier protein 1 [Archaeoglobaceae archaeon]